MYRARLGLGTGNLELKADLKVLFADSESAANSA